jgi:hypothetical protein
LKSFAPGLRLAGVLGLLTVAIPAVGAHTAMPAHAATTGIVRHLVNGGTTSFQGGAVGTTSGAGPETDPALQADNGTDGPGVNHSSTGYTHVSINRTIVKAHGAHSVYASGAAKAKSDPILRTSFDGLNHYATRYANSGNQFSTEPPDQGLCVGNGYEFESVNDVVSVYNASGTNLAGTQALNSFYGFPAAINRTTGAYGPEVYDPSCYYDAGTQRWFQLASVFERTSTLGPAFSGKTDLVLAVSTTSNPTGKWTVYSLPTQDDGTNGTPNHGDCPCQDDFPHIGADANGIFITTNEFPLSGGFNNAQFYAISKQALVNGVTSPTVVQFDNAVWNDLGSPTPAFTAWPAVSPGTSSFAAANGGTEYFPMSTAIFTNSGVDNQMVVWALSNTQSLNSAPALTLTNNVMKTQPYAYFPQVTQKTGSTPLADCINNIIVSVKKCPSKIGATPTRTRETEEMLAASDTRVQGAVFANGRLWTALDTGITWDNVNAYGGIAYFILDPGSSQIVQQGYLGLQNDNLTYPSLAVTSSGRGVLGFTVTGNDYFPSFGFAGLDGIYGVGTPQVSTVGVGPDDGFTGYAAFGSPGFARWGDYGAAVADGNNVWLAGEYIGQTCTDAQYVASLFGQCGGTRSSLANWDTRITEVTP